MYFNKVSIYLSIYRSSLPVISFHWRWRWPHIRVSGWLFLMWTPWSTKMHCIFLEICQGLINFFDLVIFFNNGLSHLKQVKQKKIFKWITFREKYGNIPLPPPCFFSLSFHWELKVIKDEFKKSVSIKMFEYLSCNERKIQPGATLVSW